MIVDIPAITVLLLLEDALIRGRKLIPLSEHEQ
jgi:hypothetical protein